MPVWVVSTPDRRRKADASDLIGAWTAAYDAAGDLVRAGERHRITLVVDGVRVVIWPADTGRDDDIRETMEVLEFTRTDSINSLRDAV